MLHYLLQLVQVSAGAVTLRAFCVQSALGP